MSTSIRPSRPIRGFSIPSRTARMVLGCALAASVLSAAPAGAESGFLEDGGSISAGGRIDFGNPSDEFLEGGGSIAVDRLDDRRPRREREFLEDGGSITSPGDGPSRRGYRELQRPETFLKHGGSIITVYDAAPRRGDDRPAISDYGRRTSRSDGIAIRGDDDTGGRGYGRGRTAYALASFNRSPGPKIIDVESARLDRRPIGRSGIDVVYAGGAKIIRIAPDLEQRTASADGAEASPAARPLEPWTREWLRHCMDAYRSFDPAFGTYRAKDGRDRFCTGE